MSAKLEQRMSKRLESLIQSLQEENRELRGHLCAKEQDRAGRCEQGASSAKEQKKEAADSYATVAKLRIQLETTKQALEVELQKKQMMCSYLNVMENNNENAAPVPNSGGGGNGERDELLDFFQALSPVK